jgi:hypothetical protein
MLKNNTPMRMMRINDRFFISLLLNSFVFSYPYD